MKKDIVWLDYTRFFGIFLVIFGHSLQRFSGWNEDITTKGIWDFIYLFHMPLFFFVSGYLYKQINCSSKLKGGGGKIFKSLVIPYLLYQVFYLPLALFDNRHEIFNAAFWGKILMGILMGDGYETPISICSCLPCWFLVCIIQIRFFFLIIQINRRSAFCICLLSVLFLQLRKTLGCDLYFCLDSTIMAFPYFLLGCFCKKYEFLEKINHRVVCSITAVALGVITSFVLSFNGSAQMISPGFGNNIFLNYLGGTAGSLMIVLLSKVISSYSGDIGYVKIVSRNTLFIIFSHWFLIRIFSGLFNRTYNYGGESTLGIICASLILSVFVLALSKLIIDYGIVKMPLLYGKKS